MSESLVINQTISPKEREDWDSRLQDPATWLRLRESAELMLERLGYATVRGAKRPDLDQLETELQAEKDLLRRIYGEVSDYEGNSLGMLDESTFTELAEGGG